VAYFVMRALAAAGRAVEGYPMVRGIGKDVTWGEMSAGAETAVAAAGFRVVNWPVPRVVMRVEFGVG
jgi:hypothetical protein